MDSDPNHGIHGSGVCGVSRLLASQLSPHAGRIEDDSVIDTRCPQMTRPDREQSAFPRPPECPFAPATWLFAQPTISRQVPAFEYLANGEMGAHRVAPRSRTLAIEDSAPREQSTPDHGRDRAELRRPVDARGIRLPEPGPDATWSRRAGQSSAAELLPSKSVWDPPLIHREPNWFSEISRIDSNRNKPLRGSLRRYTESESDARLQDLGIERFSG